MLVSLRRLQTFNCPDNREDRSVDPASALFSGVLQSELDWIYPKLVADLVNDAFHREFSLWSAGGAICGRLWLVDHNVESIHPAVLDIVWSKRAHQAGANRRTRISAGFKGEPSLYGRDLSIVGDSQS